jgi:hypothetical protein
MYATYGECASKDCIFAHRAVDERSDECVFYNRGFCKHGATCRLKHVRRQPCPLYLQGFCPEGPDCQYGHPKFELPDFDGADGREPEQPRHVRRRAPAAPRAARCATNAPHHCRATIAPARRGLTRPNSCVRGCACAGTGPRPRKRYMLQVLAERALCERVRQQADPAAARASTRTYDGHAAKSHGRAVTATYYNVSSLGCSEGLPIHYYYGVGRLRYRRYKTGRKTTTSMPTVPAVGTWSIGSR